MNDKLTVPAVIAVLAFGVLGLFQILNVFLAVPAVAGLVLLLTDKRLPIGAFAAIGALALALTVGGSYLLYETILLVVLPGAIIAACVRANKDAIFSVFIVMVPILVLSLIFLAGVGETELFFQEIKPDLEKDFRVMAERLGFESGSDGSFEEYVDMSMKMMKLMIRFLPAIFMTIFTLISAGAYMLAGYAFKREGRYLLPFPRFDHWKIKEFVMIIFGLGLLLILISDGVAEDIGENAAMYTFLLFSFGGLSIVEYNLRKRNASKAVRVIAYVGIAILNIYSAIILGIAGLIDSHFDFRRLRALRIG
ncbi:MAG TPA: DUF2232 domain-containing protein [candidate division Zixibacteria bacterium]|nr:DUF2232 domain-containing protein [candidate division Zixibacteria bacterium]